MEAAGFVVGAGIVPATGADLSQDLADSGFSPFAIEDQLRTSIIAEPELATVEGATGART